VIFTDSGCDIKPELLAEWGVPYKCLTFRFTDDNIEHSNEDMDALSFYNKMREGGVAKTAAVNVDEFAAEFEEILKKFACHVIMNIHIKPWKKEVGLTEEFLKKVTALIYKYDCQKHVYFMSGVDAALDMLREHAPEIPRCCGAGGGSWNIVERAIKYDCQKVQLMKPEFDQEMIDKAHANGIICNVFWSDDVEEAKQFLEMGIDTILTNDYNSISQVIK
jgi:glycerophosphoryl diester phosphodiesterase